MWIIPPIVGQKVTLNPSGRNYGDFSTQSEGGDGYILKVDGISNTEFMKGNTDTRIIVVWENTRRNGYAMQDLLPIDSFKTIERVEFVSGVFESIVRSADRDYVTQRVIVHDDDVKHYDFFDKEKRLSVLDKAVKAFESLNEGYKTDPNVQMRYMATLEEIERTKRAEPTVLFLEGEGVDVPTPKKHQGVDQSVPATFPFNPCVELELAENDED